MFTNRCLLTAVVLAVSPMTASGQSDNYWLVKEVTGRWEYRVGTEQPRQLTGGYEVLEPKGEVRCLDAGVSRCELRYLIDPRSDTTRPLPVRLGQSGQWVSLKTLKPPPPPVLPATSSELAARFGRVTRAGGSRAASACGGDFPLRAPTCGENIDPATFTVRWPESTSGSVAILVERADGQPALFRGTAEAADAQFADDKLTDFLRSIQSQSESVDITVRVMAQGGRSAVRLVHIPPTGRTAEFAARVKAVGIRSDATRTVTLMLLAMEESMWSRAAEQASKLVKLAGTSPSLLEYAVVGLCQSDYAEEKALLRKSVAAKRYDEICPSDSTPETAGSVPAPAATDNISRATPSKTRIGIALLIGNSEYWNMPLNSVRNDLRGLGGTLESLGFVVTTTENLRTPRHFIEALDDVLKKEIATPDDLLLVYYSGHGVQLDGKAHLLSTGVSAAARVAEDLRDNAQSAEDLLARMERSIPGRRVLIVEACRNDILSTRSSATQGARGGFAFQQDDVPNTFVMFANKPGLPAAVRTDYGLMGPFTEALVYALQNSTGEIADVYKMAEKKAIEISPGQEPMMYQSKTVDEVVLARHSLRLQDTRAKELLNGAEPLYRDRAWEEFRATVLRGRALASDPNIQQRLTSEAEFAGLVMEAKALEETQKWADAAAKWQAAHELFARREWVSMNAAVAWLLADNLTRAVHTLADMANRTESELTRQAKQMLAELTQAFPALEAEAVRASRETTKVPVGAEFEFIR